jgi:hypothetical protein
MTIYASRAEVSDIEMKYQVIQRQRTINGHRGPILEIELFTDEPAARDRAGILRDSNPEHVVSLRRVGCLIPDTARLDRRPSEDQDLREIRPGPFVDK